MTMQRRAIADAPLERQPCEDDDMLGGIRNGEPPPTGLWHFGPAFADIAVHDTTVGTAARTTGARSTRGRAAAVLLAITLPFWWACGENPTGPTGSALVTFRVVNEIFRVQLLEDEHIEAARRAQQGGPARIPVGRIVSGTNVNAGWSWHLVDVEFAEVSIELCDGLPSHVEQAGVAFANGLYCPWSAEIVAIDEVP